VNWALPQLSPVPNNYGVLNEWALCLDENKTDTNALAPGKLALLCDAREIEMMIDRPLEAVRSAFQRRLTETPGVVSLSEDQISTPLIVQAFDVDLSGIQELDEAYRLLRRKWCTPDGRPFMEAVKLWAHARELAQGFWLTWDPEPPKAWLRARTAWGSFVRHTISHNKRRLASELQVALACSRGEYKSAAYLDWQAIRETFKPNSVPVWIHDRVVDHATAWMDGNPRGIVWVEHRAMGARLSERSGRPYHGARGLDARGRMIEDAEGSVIASVGSNSVGRDLQHKWDRNLIISCSPNGKTYQQLLARTHREGQLANEVGVDLFLGCSEQYYGFRQAMQDARYMQTTIGHNQKLLSAKIVGLPSGTEIATRGRHEIRWSKGVKNE
jgi:hypothetical protein